MRTNIRGRLRNMELAHKKAILPVFEAIANSFQSLEIAKAGVGKISIRIFRDGELFAPGGENTAPINKISVTDNGEGFNHENFSSFLTSDSLHKQAKGGKGIGRFLWLKVFEKVIVESTYEDNGRFKSRGFVFKDSDNGIDNYSEIEVDSKTTIQTIVTLTIPRKEYQKHLPTKLSAFGNEIIEHCLFYFLADKCSVSIEEADGTSVINLNSVFKTDYVGNATNDSFTVGRHAFSALHLRLHSPLDSHHRIHLCAHNREVKAIDISHYIPSITGKKLRESEHQPPFYLSSYISSPYLDQSVNSQRVDFDGFHDELGSEETPSLSMIYDGSAQSVRKSFATCLEKIEETKNSAIAEFVKNSAQYRWVLGDPDSLRGIPANLSGKGLDAHLHRMTVEKQVEVRHQAQEVLDNLKTNLEPGKIEKARETFTQFMKSFNDIGKSKLADYVAYRKLLLTIFSQALKSRATGSYELEETIHKLIFPLRKTSDEVSYDQQNLWMIDERLSYHFYLASDKRLTSVTPITVTSPSRPDIVIFNNPFAFAASTSLRPGDENVLPFSSITIIEFKRPMRDDYSDEENPIAQVYAYITAIKSGKANDREGRPINLAGTKIPFYCYIVCDITPKLIEQANDYNLEPSPEGENQGFFGVHGRHNAYIEVISFSKLLADATRRNQILFDNLLLG